MKLIFITIFITNYLSQIVIITQHISITQTEETYLYHRYRCTVHLYPSFQYQNIFNDTILHCGEDHMYLSCILYYVSYRNVNSLDITVLIIYSEIYVN